MTTRHARLKATTATVCSAALLSACTTLPGNSSPEAVSSYSTTPAMEEVIQPTKGNPSDLMLRDFFAASAHPLADHEAARRFLTEDASSKWQAQGEVFVLDDGGEADLDLGNYERYLDITLSRENNLTTGKVYQHVIDREVRFRNPFTL